MALVANGVRACPICSVTEFPLFVKKIKIKKKEFSLNTIGEKNTHGEFFFGKSLMVNCLKNVDL